MAVKQHRLLGVVGSALLLLFGTMHPAHAQSRGGHGRRQGGEKPAPQQAPKDATPAPPPVAKPQGPWLERGAILCSSREDLVSYQTPAADRVKAEAPGPAPDCHTIAEQTSIRIIRRDGPSRTQVSIADGSDQTGWTNAYLSPTQ